MRGMYTDGILDVFLDQGLSFDGVIGVSAGAIHGSSFVSGQRGRNIRYYKKYIRDNRFISMRNLVRTGDIAEVQFCYHDLPEKLDLYDYDAFNLSLIHIFFEFMSFYGWGEIMNPSVYGKVRRCDNYICLLYTSKQPYEEVGAGKGEPEGLL